MKRPYVLLVEDNQDDAELTLRAFRKHGVTHEVVIAKNGVEALDFLFARGAYTGRDISDVPQLVLLDINLPMVNGLEVLKQIKGNSTTQVVPVVMLSSSREPRDIQDSYVLGANSYIQKLLDFSQFTAVMGELARYWLVLNQQPERLTVA